MPVGAEEKQRKEKQKMAASLKTHKNLLEEKVGEKSAPYTC